MENPEKSDFGYNDFYRRIDTLVMGRRTYEVVTCFDGPWPYPEVTTYVASRRNDLRISSPETRVIEDFNLETVEKIRNNSSKNIWLMGGGQLITRGLSLKVIDEMILCIIPRVLGSGIPLFDGAPPDTMFDLIDCTSFAGGAVMLTYVPKKD